MQVFQYLHLVCVSEITSEKNIYITTWWFYCLNLSGQSFCYSDFCDPLASRKLFNEVSILRKMTDFQTLGKEYYMRRINFSP